MHSLVVDADRTRSAQLVEHLRAQGLETCVAHTVEAAQKVFLHTRVDAVCVAGEVRDHSGADFTRWIRNNESKLHIPVVMYVPQLNAQCLAEAQQAGVTEALELTDADTFFSQLDQFFNTGSQSHVAGCNVLYVEDDWDEAAVIREILQGMGLEVVHVTSGEDALLEFDHFDFDLVITGAALEGRVSGLQVVRHVRHASGDKHGIPTLVVTALDDVAKRIELFRAGVNDYELKPIVAEELRARVANLLNAKLLMDTVREQQEQLRLQALTDKLTGCNNRHAMVDEAPKLIAAAMAHGEPVSLLVVDLDHFKSVNDTYGHAMGDTVLQRVGELLRESFNRGEFVARFGGEEFVVLLPAVDADAVTGLANRFRRTLSETPIGSLTVTASIGAATLEPGAGFTFQQLFNAADAAVYEAKEGGRNRVCYAALADQAATAVAV